MIWYEWIFFVLGVIFACLIVYGFYVVATDRKHQSDDADKKFDDLERQYEPMTETSTTTWVYPVDAMPPEGKPVQVITIRGDLELRQLEKVGDHVRVWKAYEDDIGIPIDEVVLWARKMQFNTKNEKLIQMLKERN